MSKTIFVADHFCGAGGTSTALADAVLVKYYGSKKDTCSVDEPLDTVTTKERFGLVQFQIDGVIYGLDIRFRMLQPHELSAAMTFPPKYPFAGNKSEQTKQIGNAVPPLMGKVLSRELLSDLVPTRGQVQAIDAEENAA